MRKIKNIVIFHFLPIEIYPPLINLGAYLSKNKGQDYQYTLITTESKKGLQKIEFQHIKVIRCRGIDPKANKLLKIYRYLYIYGYTFLVLCRLKPQVAIYFETISSLPLLLYKFLFKRMRLFVHYHELVTLRMLNKGQILTNIMNKFEQMLYSQADWISQTNEERLIIFKEQHKLNLNQGVLRVMPNYPPERWKHIVAHPQNKDLVRMLHIGTLSFNSLFLNELLLFFGNKKGFQIDFFSHSIEPKILAEFKKYNNIKFMGAIDYDKIPSLKGKYDVGLVLYKGNSLNFTYNAPNKIFEYLALDLDVWCSDKLLTARHFQNDQTYPKLLIVNFVELEHFDVQVAINREGLSYKGSSYFCEPIFKTLHDQIYAPSNS